MERVVSTLSRVSRVLYLSHRENLFLYIGNRKTLDRVDRVDRRRNTNRNLTTEVTYGRT
jgi:hypothetical protein